MHNTKESQIYSVHAILILPNIQCISAVNNLMLSRGSAELNTDSIQIKCHMSAIFINMNTI